MAGNDRKPLPLDRETRSWLREEINRRRREQELHAGRLSPRGSRRSARR